MISRIDHVSFAVKDYDKAYNFFTNILGAVPGASSTDNSMKYFWQILSLGDMSRIEILTPTGEGSFLDGFLSRKDGGVHHVTLQVPDIEEAARTLDGHNIPYFDYHNYGTVWKELFIHPRDAFGILIQIAEFNADDWLADSVKISGDHKYKVTSESGGCSIEFTHPGGGTAEISLSKSETEELIKQLEKSIK